MFEMLLNKPKFKAWFFIRNGLSYDYKKKSKFTPNPKKPNMFKYRGKQYNVNLDCRAYRKKMTNHYFFEFEGNQIITNEVQDKDSAIKELLYVDEAIKQTFRAIQQPKLYLNWIHLILAILFALSTGWILGTFIPISLNGG